MPLIETAGSATAKAYGLFGAKNAVPNYIEDVFSTYLTTGTGVSNTLTVNNGNDLAGKGGLVWGKSRNVAGSNHILVDTARGVNTTLSTDNTGAQVTSFPTISSFLSNGFTATNYVNSLADTFTFWTFRKQPKFFDVVTWTGDGTAGRTIPHNLGSVPGCIIVKRTSGAANWIVYHRSTGNTKYLLLNGTAMADNDVDYWYSTTPTSTNFTVNSYGDVNGSGSTYVAYIYAHNAGGFGLTGTDNVISCGSFTTDGSGNATVNLGYEPQWLMTKTSTAATNWFITDNMRGFALNGTQVLNPNTSAAESANPWFQPNATGFDVVGGYTSQTFIYIAIRRGPMKVPTDATKVFAPVSQASHGTVTTNFPVDLSIATPNALATNKSAIDRLRGNDRYLWTNSTNADASYGSSYTFNYATNTGFVDTYFNSGFNIAYWNFRRAPSFFDEVCWTGASADQTLNHNLAAIPELIIYKRRGSTGNWYTGCTFTSSNYSNLNLNLTNAASTLAYTDGGPFSAQPTATQFSVGQFYSTTTMVAYLFATCAGVSKVGSYTGTGATQTISCGFTGGARFVLVKRTDSTGDWYVWDTARGMVSGTDPSLLLNSTAAEVNANSIYTATTGFQIVSTAAGINASGGTYIYLAIA